ncbi:MAG: LPS export ABC transporter periplasmic protein LptC [Oligoflexia bacterium]|nr:LPS export ABC transporter periplasmic protein LptC [Oligoflexia bacterium]
MRRLKKWGLAALFILLGLEILTLAPKSLNTPQEAAIKPKVDKTLAPKSAVTTMSQMMHGVHLVETSAGKKEWELDSDYAQGFKDKGTWKLQGVHVKFFGAAGTEYSVTGDKGSVHTETKDMEINGHVVTTTSDGYMVKSNSLKYVSTDKTLSTPDHVEITGPETKDGKFEMVGRGLQAVLDTSTMTLKDQVRASKSVTGNRDMVIHSKWARINGKNNQAHFEDNVQVDLENVRMTGQQADFVYESNTKSLTSLLLQGNVRVTDRQRWAASQQAQVLFAENEFILLGNPRVLQDDNELRGEEIRFINGGKEVRVIKAKARVENELNQINSNTTKRP